MKKLEGLKYFLGIEVDLSSQGIFLSQRKYVLNFLSETGMLQWYKTMVWENTQSKYLQTKEGITDLWENGSTCLIHDWILLILWVWWVNLCIILVKIIWIRCSRFYDTWKDFPGKGLMFKKWNHLNIDGYTDVDWAGNTIDRKFEPGYFTFVEGNLVTWRSKK